MIGAFGGMAHHSVGGGAPSSASEVERPIGVPPPARPFPYCRAVSGRYPKTLLAPDLDLKTAIAILVLPLVVSNLSQSFEGGMFPATLRRVLAALVTLFVSAALSTRALVALPERTLFTVAGAAIIVLPLVTYFRPGLRVGSGVKRWLGLCPRAIGGFLGGVSAVYGAPLMIFLAAPRLPKAEFVPAVSLMFFVGSLGLTIGLLGLGVTGTRELGLSALATLSVFAGMTLGQRVRIALNERQFGLLLLAIYLVICATFLLKGLRWSMAPVSPARRRAKPPRPPSAFRRERHRRGPGAASPRRHRD